MPGPPASSKRAAQPPGPPRSPEEDRIAKADAADPGKYNPHSSYTSNRRGSFGAAPPIQANLLAMTTEGKRRGKKLEQKPAFGGSVRRALVMEIMGEDCASPGPGAYLPSSTFGKHAKYQDKASKGPSSQFRSTSPQRPKAHNENVPGPGGYSPDPKAIEPKACNPANSLVAKSSRFGAETDWASSATDRNVGPGQYDSHHARTVQQDATRQVQRMSRQNPGFGIAGPAHKLPHEQPVDEAQFSPGPGKYETNTSEIAKANGHGSAFKLPTERKKGKGLLSVVRNSPGHGSGSRARRASTKKSAAASPADGTVHV